MKKAFTLAEVLIVIVIIAIIAIITFPILSKNYQEKKIKSLLKKSHSIISQALSFYYLDYGMLATGDYFEPRTFKHVFKNHFNIIKDYQVFITCTYINSILKFDCLTKNIKLYNIENGTIKK